MSGPRVLILDIEISPIEAYVWGIHDQNIGVNQIKKDWQIISWAAKWLNHKKIYQEDTRIGSEVGILYILWDLIDSADIIVTQNGKEFDIKKINARFLHYKMRPVSSFQHIDTRKLAKKYFGFTSNSLEYMSKTFNEKYKKLQHKKFPGQELWTECLKGNKKAWAEMAKYNKYDVLATEELYKRLIPFDNSVNFSLYNPKYKDTCSCGNTKWQKNGHKYGASSKYQRYCCSKCGSERRSWKNEAKKVLR